MENHPINKAYAALEYEDDADLLEAWRLGQTGVPMIDACMRCLKETGFLNFRMRAMLVSFACFGFKLSWKFIHEPLAKVFSIMNLEYISLAANANRCRWV